MPENISNIAKYNIENGTHFWKLSQVNQHKQQKAAEEFEKKHPILASFTKSAQDVRDAKIGAIGAGQVRDLYNTGNSSLASELNQKYLGANATGILNVPIGSEIATYGLLGGGLRLGAGTATGAAGSWLGGKAGDLADKQFGTNWIGTTGRIGGGFAGFVPGINAATRVLRTAAGKGVTLYMPQNTFMGLRGQAFDNVANAAVKHSTPTIVDKNIFAGKIGWSPKESRVLWHNSETPISKLETTFPTWDVTKRGAPLGHVWTTGTETTQGFIGARPYHNRGVVELNKPMVQLNESIGNGKNAVRNEILKFADQSGADAVNFSNIKDNTLSNQDVYSVFKDVNVKPKLTEAERLGIPKGERSNTKALEDPQYWGYQQWNNKYNEAVNSKNLEEIQRLRNLHFKIKAPHTAAENVVSHGSKTSDNTFNIFNTDIRKNGWNGELTGGAFFGSGDQQALNQFARDSKLRWFYLNIEKPNIIDAQNRRYDNLLATWLTPEEVEARIPRLRKNGFSESSIEEWLNKTAYSGTAEDYAVKTMSDKNYDSLIIKNVYEGGMSKDYGTPITDYVATKPTQIKLWDSKTYDDVGKIIPIVKRDNFHNPDIRYKQGGILKAQNGAELTKWINNWYTNRPAQFNNYVMFDQNTAINRSNSINEKYEPWDIIQSVIPNSNDSKSDMIGGYYKKSTNTLHLPNTYKKTVNGVVYEAPINPISLNPSNYIHEKTHGIFDLEQKDQIEGILGNQMKDAYYDSPTEVNSRLMEIRYLNGFDPKHIFNKQEVEQLKKNPNFKDRDIFNRYDSEIVVKLLNEVASNQSLKNNLSEYSKQGGIIKAQNGSILPMSPFTFAKYQAYKIVTDPNVWWKAGANWKDIAKNLVRLKPVMEDQNKSEFIFGVKRPETTDREAYDWAKDIEDNNYKNVKSYEGILNPYNEYIIGNKYKDLVKSLVDSGYSTSLNINDEYSDPETGRVAEGTPYFDDVHGYRIRFHRDKDGNPVISASDLYDFGKNYTESFQDLNIERGGNGNIEWQRKALNLIGQPYKLVQHNIPIKFVDDDFPSNRKKSFEIQVLNK